MTRFRVILIAGLLLVVNSVAGRAQEITLTVAERARLRQLVESDREAGQLFAAVLKDADAALANKPNPIRSIESEGKLNSDPAKVRTLESLADKRKMHALGWAFAVTSQAAYAEKAREFVMAWARTNTASGNPINETNLEPHFIAYDLTRSQFSANDRAVVESWLRQVANAEMGSKRNGTEKNNWQSHRLKIIGLIGYTLKDQDLIRHAVDGFRRQVAENLLPDGSSFDFHERDALHYHCYDLVPLLALATAAKRHDLDLYTYRAKSGASLEKSVRFLVPYCEGTKTHAEWVHSRVAFDKKRADSGDPHYKAGRYFEPKEGAGVLEAVAFFDGRYLSTYQKAAGTAAAKYPSWQFVLNAAREPKTPGELKKQ